MTTFDLLVGVAVVIAVVVLGGELLVAHQRRQEMDREPDDALAEWRRQRSRDLDARRSELDAIARGDEARR